MGLCYGPVDVTYTDSAIYMLGTPAGVGGGPALAGDLLVVHHDSWTWSGPAGGTGYIYFYNWTNPAASDSEFLASPDSPHDYSYVCPNDGLYSVSTFVLPAAHNTINFHNLSLSAPFCAGVLTPAGVCAYGTEPKPGSDPWFFWQPDWVTLKIGQWGAWFYQGLGFPSTPQWTAGFCATLPSNDLPTVADWLRLWLTSPLSDDAWRRVRNLLYWDKWNDLCQCAAAPIGSPPPTPIGDPIYEGPPVTVPAPPPPTTCDNTDWCATLDTIRQEILAIRNSLEVVRFTTTLTQRQGVPFGYVQGRTHSGLTGKGEFGVLAILGLVVQYTTVPSTIAVNSYDPVTYYNLGRITLGTDDGWRQSHYAQHNPWQLLPIDGDVTRVAYTFADGAVANIVELVRAP